MEVGDPASAVDPFPMPAVEPSLMVAASVADQKKWEKERTSSLLGVTEEEHEAVADHNCWYHNYCSVVEKIRNFVQKQDAKKRDAKKRDAKKQDAKKQEVKKQEVN